jgi:long-chain fatty acid transport protein
MLAYYHPLNEDMVAGISVFSPSGLGIKWESEDLANISRPPNPNLYPPNPNINWESMIFMVTIAPSFSYKISDQFSIGAALNVNYVSVDLHMYASPLKVGEHPLLGPLYVDLGQQEVKLTGWGFGATFGVLAKPSDMFSIGASFKIPVHFNLSGDVGIAGGPQLNLNASSEAETEITWPLWLAAGVAFRPVERLVLTFDIQYTDWKQIDVLELSFTDSVWNTLLPSIGANEMDFHWSSETQIRIGAEFMVSDHFALRGGYYYDPSPAPDRTLNILLPSASFNAIAGGFGYNSNGLEIDFTVEYLMGKDRTVPLTGEMPGLYELTVLAIEFSVGYGWQ